MGLPVETGPNFERHSRRVTSFDETGRDTLMTLIGTTIDERYDLLSLLGEGGMGAVYLARDRQSGAEYALKILREELGDHAETKERFQREAQALYGLTHPAILRVHDIGLLGDRPYLVMDRLEGETLDARLEREEKLPLPVALPLYRQMLEGLAYAHSQGAVHRDLKSENVNVDTAGKVTLLDFGLVKFTDDDRWGKQDKPLTMMGSVFGTPAYMAPEQCTGAPADKRADVYAAAVILYEMLTGEWPFMMETRLEMFKAHLTAEVPSVEPFLGTPAPALDAFIRKAMEKLPQKRFQDAAEMLQALDALTAELAAPAQQPMTPSAMAQSPTPETPRESSAFLQRVVIAAALVVALLFLAAFLLTRS